ncbi:MAG: acyltransferase [Pseudomonadota bacterium]
MNERIHSLQALRFVAAAMVTLLHVQQGARLSLGLPVEGGVISNIGSFGVDIFFVLSGYIICRTAAGMKPADFFARRVARVVPIYWLATLLFLPFAVAAGFNGLRGIASLTFYPGFGLPWLAVGWTLCFEMLFYTVTAIVLIRPRSFLPLALAVYAACWVAREAWGGPFQFFGNPIVLEFLFGAALTRVTARSPVLGVAALGTAVALLAMVASAGLADANNVYGLVAGETALARVAAMGVPAALVVWAALNFEMPRTVLSDLGDASYSLYLVHSHVVAAALLALPLMPEALFTALVTLLAIAAGLAMHRLVEKPMLAAVRRPRRAWRLAPA